MNAPYQSQPKRRLFWVGDGVDNTGFGRVTTEICPRLMELGWDVSVLGINYNGDPHRFPFKMYPARNDASGTRFIEVEEKVSPDVTLICSDPWVISDHLEKRPTSPVVGYTLLDGPNLNPKQVEKLWNCESIGSASLFGTNELEKLGNSTPLWTAEYGVDHEIFQPMDRIEARKKVGLFKKIGDGFLFGAVNRNTNRKRYDLMLSYWAEWWERAGKPEDAWLYLHVANDDQGWDILQLANYFGIVERVLLPTVRGQYLGVNESFALSVLRFFYCSMNVLISTGMGEGFGFTHAESMSCRIAQIAGNWAALPTWATSGVAYVPCSNIAVHQGGINTIGGIVDREEFIAALDWAYKTRNDHLLAMGQAAERVAGKLDWMKCTKKIHIELCKVIFEKERAQLDLAEIA